jgi:spore coat polysaccharide biosynthesis protein SpsF
MLAVVTSVEKDDDLITAWADSRGVRTYRGPLEDVAHRFLEASRAFELDAFVRINADSPLVDPALIDGAVDRYRSGDAEVVSNVVRRTFPVGLSVELVDTGAFTRAYALMRDPRDREHVTRYIYSHPTGFRIESIESTIDRGDRTLAVDTPDDLERIEALVAGMVQPHWEYDAEEVCRLAEGLGLLAERSDVAP